MSEKTDVKMEISCPKNNDGINVDVR
jgi:hypothetical protein